MYVSHVVCVVKRALGVFTAKTEHTQSVGSNIRTDLMTTSCESVCPRFIVDTSGSSDVSFFMFLLSKFQCSDVSSRNVWKVTDLCTRIRSNEIYPLLPMLEVCDHTIEVWSSTQTAYACVALRLCIIYNHKTIPQILFDRAVLKPMRRQHACRNDEETRNHTWNNFSVSSNETIKL